MASHHCMLLCAAASQPYLHQADPVHEQKAHAGIDKARTSPAVGCAASSGTLSPGLDQNAMPCASGCSSWLTAGSALVLAVAASLAATSCLVSAAAGAAGATAAVSCADCACSACCAGAASAQSARSLLRPVRLRGARCLSPFALHVSPRSDLAVQGTRELSPVTAAADLHAPACTLHRPLGPGCKL